MPDRLTTTGLLEICTLVTDGTHDSPKIQSSGVPFIKGKDISTGRLDFESCDFITEEDHLKCIKRVEPQRDDVLFANIGSVGDVARVTDERQFSIKNVALFRPNIAKVDPTYFYYLVVSPTFRSLFKSVRSGAAQPFISLKAFRSHRFRFNSDQVQQRRIASILTAYDDLIENNRRRMALLEESARLLYREWFVHLRFPGHATARVSDGIPEGWRSQPLSEITDFLKRGIAPKYDDDAEGLVINQKCIRNTSLNMELARRQNRDFKEERQIRVGDVLVNSTGTGTLGRVAQVRNAVENCTVDTHVTIVRRLAEIMPHYFGMAVGALEPVFSTMGRGSTNQTELSPAAIGEVPILIPERRLQIEFDNIVSVSFQQRETLAFQTQKLKTARDLLLPKLMSGEIEV